MLVLKLVAYTYFLFAVVDLVGWFIYHGNIVRITESDPPGIRILGALTQILAMLPTPGLLFWAKYVAARVLHYSVLQFGTPGLLYHLFIACLAVVLGFGLQSARGWAIKSLAAFCVLALAANFYLLRGLFHIGHTDVLLRGGAVFYLLPNIIGIIVSIALLIQLWRTRSTPSFV